MGKESFIIYTSFYKPISILSDKQLGRLFRAIFEYQLSGVVDVEEDIRMAFEFFKNQFEIDESKYQAKIKRNNENGHKGGNPNFQKGKSNPYYDKKENKITGDNPNITEDNPTLPNITEDKPINENENVNDIIIPPVCIPPLQGGNTHTELLESDKPPEQDNPVTTELPPVAEEKEKSCAKKEKEPVKRFQKPTIEEVKAYIAEKGYDVDAERFWNFYEAKDWFIGKNKMKNWHAAVATWQKKETDYVDIRQKRHDRRRGSEIRATCAEDYSEPL